MILSDKYFSFIPLGGWKEIKRKEKQYITILDGNILNKKRKKESDRKYRISKGIFSKDVKKVYISNKLIKEKQAQDVSSKDILLTILSPVGNVFLEKDKSWIIGVCAADGHFYKGGGSSSVCFTINKNESHSFEIKNCLKQITTGKISERKHGEGNGWRIRIGTKASFDFFRKYIVKKGTEKRFAEDVFDLDKESRLHLVGGYLDGDGSFNKREKKIIANNYSENMTDQIYRLLLSSNIVCSFNKYPLYGEHFKTKSEWCYRIIIPSSEVPKIQPYMRSKKIPIDFKPKKSRKLRFFYKENNIEYFAQPIKEILYRQS